MPSLPPDDIPAYVPTSGTITFRSRRRHSSGSQEYDYSNNGSVIKAFVGVDNYFRAPVYLPVGAKITDLAACFFDNTNC